MWTANNDYECDANGCNNNTKRMRDYISWRAGRYCCEQCKQNTIDALENEV